MQESTNHKVEFFYIDCTNDLNAHNCLTYEVELLPTFLMFNADQIKNKPLKYEINQQVSSQLVFEWAF